MHQRFVFHASNCPANMQASASAICTCGAWKASVEQDLARHEQERAAPPLDPYVRTALERATR